MNWPCCGQRARINVPAFDLDACVGTLLNRNRKERARDGTLSNAQPVDRSSRTRKAHVGSGWMGERIYLQDIGARLFDLICQQWIETLHAVRVKRQAHPMVIEQG